MLKQTKTDMAAATGNDGSLAIILCGISRYPCQAVVVIIIERAILLMVSGGIKVIIMVSGIHYWYHLVSG
jgi:hypothetical protein